ncbi:MAG: hypothetical protein JNM17_01935 [Archangium sp.]|nr:hypothetical protein [Archangium sp.]
MESLPAKLETLFAAEVDQDFSARTRMVCLAAARTISQMGELDLVQYEEPDVEGSADLSMWEKVAPIIGSTIAEVNTLVAQAEASFPPGELLVDPRQQNAEALVHTGAAELKTEVMNFGMRIRDPSVVGDRWNLLTELQTFRFRFRDRIGKLVWELASVFGECKRREVEPGYDEDLAATLVVRTMTADLRRLMRVRIHKVGEAQPGEMLAQAQQMEKELNAFGRTAAWRALRAQDKKGILEFRFKLRQLIGGGAPSKIEILELLEPFVEFVDGFAGISQREILVQHDQEILASVGLSLERAMNALTAEDKLAAFKEALEAGMTLYGRAPDFDAFLRNQRKGLPPPEALQETVEQFLVQIAGLSQY